MPVPGRRWALAYLAAPLGPAGHRRRRGARLRGLRGPGFAAFVVVLGAAATALRLATGGIAAPVAFHF